MLNHQNFSYQNFVFGKFSVFLTFTNFSCHVMSEHEILKYFCPILDKKEPPEDKELPDPSGLLSKVIPLSSISSLTYSQTTF